MKAVILAGGLGTRLSEETTIKPKPMVDIGGRPILWHIMKGYSAHGINDFVICVGYKGYMIKKYFANYFMHMSNVTIDFVNNSTEIHQNHAEPWRVTLVDTGERSMTGGRLKRVRRYLGDEDFCLTYGDGVSDVDITALIKFHRQNGTLATLIAVQPPGRFGALDLHGHSIAGFHEKPIGDGGWVNGGFFVLNPKVIDYIAGDATMWEQEPMEQIAAQGQLSAFKHHGFWQPMDTLCDKILLDELWETGNAFLEGRMTKHDFIRDMYQLHHAKLFEYADYLQQTDIAAIEISDGWVIMTSRDKGIKMICPPLDQRVAPIEAIRLKLPKVDFIKCDVEGAELFVFLGGMKLLERDTPIVFSEMLRKWAAKFAYHPNQIIRLFTDLGYRCFTAKGEKLIEFFCMNDETIETNYFFLHAIKHAEQIEMIT